MKRKDFTKSMELLTVLGHLINEYKQTKKEKILDQAMMLIETHHYSLNKQYRKNRRKVATDEINQLIEEMNKNSEGL